MTNTHTHTHTHSMNTPSPSPSLHSSHAGKIGCTQPRRVAAMSVAARVAAEMNVKLGTCTHMHTHTHTLDWVTASLLS
jgi:hypothetical protein